MVRPSAPPTEDLSVSIANRRSRTGTWNFVAETARDAHGSRCLQRLPASRSYTLTLACTLLFCWSLDGDSYCLFSYVACFFRSFEIFAFVSTIPRYNVQSTPLVSFFSFVLFVLYFALSALHFDSFSSSESMDGWIKD